MEKQTFIQEKQHISSLSASHSLHETESDDEENDESPINVVKTDQRSSKWKILIIIVLLFLALFLSSLSTRSLQKLKYSEELTKEPVGTQTRHQEQSVTHQETQKQNKDLNRFSSSVYKQTPADSEYSQIYDQKGYLYNLKYRKPSIFRPDQVQETSPGQIGYINQTLAKEYIASQKDHASLVYSFVKNKDKRAALEAEYYYYSQKYKINEAHQELSLCIVSPYRNFYKSDTYTRYLYFLENQNYSNFQVVLIDDMSPDNSTERLKKTLKEYPRINNRAVLVKNLDKTGALGNRDLATRKICKNDSVIVQIDADDYIIGRQVFNLYNTYYREHPQVWFLYSNYIHIEKKGPILGKNGPITNEIYEKNTYRYRTNYWVTIHLRSYLKELYMKIPVANLLEQPDRYYLWASDRFNMYAIAQLAGKQHSHYLSEEVYFYVFPEDSKRPNCELLYIRQTDYVCRYQSPLLPLKSLSDEVEVTREQNLKIPKQIQQRYQEYSQKLKKCMEKFKLTKETISK